MMLGVGAVLLGIAAVVGFLFSRSITKPISRLTGTMNALAEGKLETEIQGAGRGDEIGDMAKAVQVFKENALKVNEMTEGERARLGAAPRRAHPHDAGAAEILRRGGRCRHCRRFLEARRRRVPR